MSALHHVVPTTSRRLASSGVLVALLYFAVPRRVGAEDRMDLKTLVYQEDGDRMRVVAPSVLVEKELSANTTIRLEGMYNVISGMSPTGGPPGPVAILQPAAVTAIPFVSAAPVVAVDSERDEVRGESGDREREGVVARTMPIRFLGLAGATPTVAPAPAPVQTTATRTATANGGATPTVVYREPGRNAKVPKAPADDERVGFNLTLQHRAGRHLLGVNPSYSAESDYVSFGLGLTDAIDFNQKNTTLTLGAAMAHDRVDAFYLDAEQTKDTVDLMLGVTQVLDRKTTVTANLTLGKADGYLTDPYKVVELNGQLTPELRPDSRQRQILLLSFNRYLENLKAGVEGSYRYYSDDFGVDASTLSLAWYQEVGEHWVIRPAVRYYSQSEADFYGVRFSGSPRSYSSDYRLSRFDAFGYGVKFIYTPGDRVALDLAIDRYVQDGRDGATWSDAYPQATSIQLGLRLWL